MNPASIVAALLLAAACTGPAVAQADSCRGAMSRLNWAKEQMSPQLNARTGIGQERLDLMLSVLARATNVCKDVPELWSYRQLVHERRFGKKDPYVERRLATLHYEAAYNPFVPPDPAVSVAEPASTRVRRKWALVVGIDEFRDRHVSSLHYAVKDAGDFAAFLKDPEGGRFRTDRVRLVVNENATLQGIREGLGWLRANVEADDLVVIYFSTHGSPRDFDPNGVSYIITHDTNLDGADKLYATSLQMIDLVQELNRQLKARRVTLILDACFSGDAQTAQAGAKTIVREQVWSSPAVPAAGASSSSVFSEALRDLKMGYGRAVITASRADERSWESAELKNGYFTHFLLSALREGRGGQPLEEIFPRVQEKVMSGVQSRYGVKQTPSCEFSERAGSIVLGVPEGDSPEKDRRGAQ